MWQPVAGCPVVRGRALDVWLGSDGVPRLVVTATDLVGDDTRWLLDTLDELTGGQRVPVLADIRKLRSIDLDLRKVMTTDRAGSLISAAAVWVSNPVNRMLGSFFLKLNHPPFDMRLFSDDTEAHAWALAQK